MKKIRSMGKMVAAIAAAVTMTAVVAVAPASAADAGVCNASTQSSFADALNNSACSTIKITGNSDGVLKFNETKAVLGLVAYTGYDTPAQYSVNRDVTITSDNDVVMRNVQFNVENGSLTFDGNVILDDAELSGLTLLGLLQLGPGNSPAGIDYGVKVGDNGTFTMNGNSRMAVGAGQSTTRENRAIVLTSNSATVNLNSGATYKRESQAGLAFAHTGLGLLDTLLNTLLRVLSIDRTGTYPTVWGRDAAVYSNPNVTDATINITAGSYLNQKDKHTLTEVALNGAISSSATVNITGSSSVKISNTKIGNGIDSSYAGLNTTGTLNVSNKNAILDPGVEVDSTSTKASTDSYALELRGSATANIVAGSVLDTLSAHASSPKVIETESDSKVNILAVTKGDVNIAGRQYWIEQTQQKTDSSFTAQVNSAVSAVDGEDTNAYELWASGSAAKDDPLAQLAALTTAEVAGNDPAAAKQSASAYTTGRINAAYLDAAGSRAVYGRHIIATAGETPFTNAGTITLYGAPWTGTYKPGDAAPEQTGKLFAGWYTSQSAFKTEDNTQATSLNQGATGTNPKHHTWQTGDTMWNNTLVLDKSNYEGGLYAHFVDEGTITLSAQTATAADGTRSVRFLSGVDSYNFKSSSFTVALAGGKTGTITSTTAYDYVTAGDAKTAFAANPYYKAYSDDFTVKTAQGDARYLTTGVLTGLPADTAVTLTVTPKWTTLDGTTVSGSAYTVAVAADGSVTITKA